MATNTDLDIVFVTHDQLKRRAEMNKRTSKVTHEEGHRSTTDSPHHSDKERNDRSKSRREKEQRKPDQELYRPGRSRQTRNSSSAGSDLNSSRDESPTKPQRGPAKGNIGSHGDRGSAVKESNSTREPSGTHKEAGESMVRGSREKVHPGKASDSGSAKDPMHKEAGRESMSGGSREKGHPAKASDRSRRESGRKEHSRRAREDRWDGDDDSGRKPASRGNEKHKPAGQGRRDTTSRHTDGRNREKKDSKSDESWEIKPEDWETDIKHETKPRVDSNAAREGHGSKGRKHQAPPEPKPSSRASHPVSLMGEDWDRDFEHQYQTQNKDAGSPPKHHDERKHSGSSRRRDSGENYPKSRSNMENRNSPEQADRRQGRDSKGKHHEGYSRNEGGRAKSAPKPDLVKSSRQNYASEMQKLRAKKEQVEKENVWQEEMKTAPKPSNKDLQITFKPGPETNEDTRLVQEKSTKRYSSGRSRQKMNSESSTGSENASVEKHASKSHDWAAEVEDLNFHVETMVITNQKFQAHDFDNPERTDIYHDKRRPENREERRLRDEKLAHQNEAAMQVESKNQHLERREQYNEGYEYSRQDVHGHGRDRDTKRREVPSKDKMQGEKLDRPRDGKHDRLQREQSDRRRNDSGGRREALRRSGRDRKSVSSDDGSERHGRRRGSSEADESGNKHGGGIIRLPSSSEAERTQHQHHAGYVPVYDQFYQPPEPHKDVPLPKKEEPRPKTSGRAGDKSRLWDPSKPDEKPALHQPPRGKQEELQFHDPELEPEDTGGRNAPAPSQDAWGAYFPYYPPPGFGTFYHPNQLPQPPGMPPPPFACPPPPGYPATPPQSWAEQVDPTFKSSPSPMPQLPPHMLRYPQPFTGQPYAMQPPSGSYPNPAHLAMMQEHQSVNRQSAQKLLRDAARCETELYNALGHGIASRDALHQLLEKQEELEQVYEGIILLDLDLCNQFNVEQTLWKNSYYQLIEGLRKAIQETPNGESYREDLLDFMQHGTSFYEGLLAKLQSTYNFQLEHRTGLDPLHEEPRRSIKLALLSAQRCMIALGDIARYKEQVNETSNYGKARSWYMKAQHLAPRNGRPYNQLAILALYTRRKLDAVYYYVRSLAATNPFLTARESLMTLFEEVRRKVAHKEEEEMEARRELEKRREQRRRRRRPSGDENRGRREVWVTHEGRHMGGDRLEEEEEDAEEILKLEDLTRLPPAELNKKFVLSFLNVHGKLFTKTGMEAFEHAVEQLLREFRALLDHTPSAILSTRLIQLMAINMFAAANTNPQGDSPSTSERRPLIMDQSVQLGLDMFALLVNRCCTLLQGHLDEQDNDQCVLSQDLHEFLPGVKVYADWMMCHSKFWNPPPCCNTTSFGAAVDVWSTLADFLNLVKRVAVPDVKFAMNNEEGSQEVLLPEDMALSGFVPLMALPLQPVFIQADSSKIMAHDRVRLDSLTMFGEYLSGQETPLISFSVKTDAYVSVAPKVTHSRQMEERERHDVDELNQDGDGDVIVMDAYEEEEDVLSPGDGTISRLRERRDSLERQLRDRERRDAKIQAIVESHRSQRVLELVIKPYILVPDTNCFIDHLVRIQRLVSCERYLIVIPLVVINELDGLARGGREGHFADPHHALRVQQGAQEAVGYLEGGFASRNRCLRALTAKGTVMDTIRFRSEEADWRGNNDDHILRCCMHYCQDDARNYMPTDKDSALRIEREVVLLTNDRNLRVKAIQQNVPVKDIVMFMKWAKV